LLLKKKNLPKENIRTVKSRRASCYYKLKDYHSAYKDITEAILFSKPKAAVEDYILRINCEIELSKKEKAKKTIEIALRHYPQHQELLKLAKGMESI
ncbi:MAG: hypothetical protein ACFFD4_34940, partial [Candidatus Odinarchaeota archaeon]